MFKHLHRKGMHYAKRGSKGTDFRDITQEQVIRVQNILNSSLRKRLRYMTSKEKFKQLTNLDYNAVALSA